MNQTLKALDPRKGNNLGQKYGPLFATVVTIAVAVLAIFGFVPGLDAAGGLAILGGAGAGHYVRSQV